MNIEQLIADATAVGSPARAESAVFILFLTFFEKDRGVALVGASGIWLRGSGESGDPPIDPPEPETKRSTWVSQNGASH